MLKYFISQSKLLFDKFAWVLSRDPLRTVDNDAIIFYTFILVLLNLRLFQNEWMRLIIGVWTAFLIVKQIWPKSLINLKYRVLRSPSAAAKWTDANPITHIFWRLCCCCNSCVDCGELVGGNSISVTLINNLQSQSVKDLSSQKKLAS